ncbi:MAG TPA: mandelate racemase/muconate lactonizing enzyme family protein [Anaerolineae bacterium]|nr:mandelate racemase/muconate lactonizing enzyme family protein [Anaerolineae bacterium]HQI84079.1 mandelate racemase/muconate lactonizing enzyme family protein [Anaerolineae bacterium]
MDDILSQETRLGQVENAINTYSRPSDLKITDLRYAVVWSNYDYPIIRLDTNQGVYGIGEVRDAGHPENALQFKSMLLGQNPCNVDMIFRTIKQFGNWGREGGGVSGIELALWDLVGKVYGVPCYQFLGGKYRDKIRIYADTPEPDEPTPQAYAQRALGRKQMGLTFIKCDVRIQTLQDIEGGMVGQPTKFEYGMGQRWRAPGSGQVVKVTDKGIAALAAVLGMVREAVGWDVSLCIDHYGHGYMTAKEVIKLAEALEPYALAWMEDPMPLMDVAGHKRVTDAVKVPIAAGEDWYLWDGFRPFIEARAVDIIHPDLLTSGGMLETKKIADYAERYGIPTGLHFAGSPIAFMANLHTAAAIPSFIALEHHGLDLPFWSSLVTGLDDPLMEDGYVNVPEKPGLGVDLNYEGIRAQLRDFSGLFEPTEYWNTPKLGFWQPDRVWDK